MESDYERFSYKMEYFTQHSALVKGVHSSDLCYEMCWAYLCGGSIVGLEVSQLAENYELLELN